MKSSRQFKKNLSKRILRKNKVFRVKGGQKKFEDLNIVKKPTNCPLDHRIKVYFDHDQNKVNFDGEICSHEINVPKKLFKKHPETNKMAIVAKKKSYKVSIIVKK